MILRSLLWFFGIVFYASSLLALDQVPPPPLGEPAAVEQASPAPAAPAPVPANQGEATQAQPAPTASQPVAESPAPTPELARQDSSSDSLATPPDEEPPIQNLDHLPQGPSQPVKAEHAMVVSSDPHASRAGLEVLKKGGNAVDAAVVMGLTMAVTYPRAGNLGGGGFMLLYHAQMNQQVALDYREKAPYKAHRDMFLNEAGQVDQDKARYSHLSAGVPGTVAGLSFALARWGTLSWKEALAPAIRLAEEGFVVDEALSQALKRAEQRLKAWPATAKVFFKPDGSFYEPGDLLVQKDLAQSLKSLAEQGPKAFYQGEIAQKIAKQMQAQGGLMDLSDLKRYLPAVRSPVRGSYRGYSILSMPPPSSGGVHLIEILQILEGFKLEELGHNQVMSVHLMSEAMKLAYADRAKYLGDQDYVKVPLQGLTSRNYAHRLRQQISWRKAKPSAKIHPGPAFRYNGRNTTHFNVVDAWGNVVANTTTLNFSFGSGIVVEGTGILLNNEMDDFSAKPGEPNAYGLIGGEANAIEGGKRMLSSMSPTIVLDKHTHKPLLVTGSPGGSRIITTTLQVIVNRLDHKMNIQEAVNAPRFHHQWLPEVIEMEPGFSDKVTEGLQKKGHETKTTGTMGAAHSIAIDPQTGELSGAVDPRRPQALAVGY